MATAKQRTAQSRMKRAAKACKGKTRSGFQACMRRELKAKR